jgi:hypothetical protein
VNVYVTMLPTTRLASVNLNVIGFTMAIFGVVQIGIIFSSLVVDPLQISQSLSFRQGKTINLISYFPASISA